MKKNFNLSIFYEYSRVLSYNALLNFLLGERGVGKTYGITKFVVFPRVLFLVQNLCCILHIRPNPRTCRQIPHSQSLRRRQILSHIKSCTSIML